MQYFQLSFVFLKEKLQRILRIQMRLWKRCRSFYWLLWCAIEHFFKGLGVFFIFQIVRRNCFSSRRFLESTFRILNRVFCILKVSIGFRPILQIKIMNFLILPYFAILRLCLPFWLILWLCLLSFCDRHSIKFDTLSLSKFGCSMGWIHLKWLLRLCFVLI